MGMTSILCRHAHRPKFGILQVIPLQRASRPNHNMKYFMYLKAWFDVCSIVENGTKVEDLLPMLISEN